MRKNSKKDENSSNNGSSDGSDDSNDEIDIGNKKYKRRSKKKVFKEIFICDVEEITIEGKKKQYERYKKIMLRGGMIFEKMRTIIWNCRKFNKSNLEIAQDKVNYLKDLTEKHKPCYIWIIDSVLFPDINNYIKLNWRECALYIRSDITDNIKKKQYAIESEITKTSFTYIKPFVNNETREQIKLILGKSWNIAGDINQGTHKVFAQMFGLREDGKQTVYIPRINFVQLVDIVNSPSDHQALIVDIIVKESEINRDLLCNTCKLKEEEIIELAKEGRIDEIKKNTGLIPWKWRKIEQKELKEDARTIILASSKRFYEMYKRNWRGSKKETYLGQKAVEQMKETLKELAEVKTKEFDACRIQKEELELDNKVVEWKGSYSKALDHYGMNFGNIAKKLKEMKIKEVEAIDIAENMKRLGEDMKPFFLKKGKIQFISDINDTRLLLIVPVYIRIIEDVLANYIIKAIEKRIDKSSIYQYGFITKRATYDVTAEVNKWMKEEDWTYIISVDFKRAFDMISIHKLQRAITADSKLDMKDKKRIKYVLQQFNELNIKLSDGEVIQKRRGVPMGARLAPLMFNLYLEYATQEVRESRMKWIYYADNGYWLVPRDEIERALRFINNMEEEWNLRVNKKKTEYITNGMLLDDRFLQVGYKKVAKMDILGRLIDAETKDFDKEEIIKLCTEANVKSTKLPLKALARIIITGVMAKLRYKLLCGMRWAEYGELIIKKTFSLYKKQIIDFTWNDFIMINKNFTILLLDEAVYRGMYREKHELNKETEWPLSDKANKNLKYCMKVDADYDNVHWFNPDDWNAKNKCEFAKEIYEIIQKKAMIAKYKRIGWYIQWDILIKRKFFSNTYIIEGINSLINEKEQNKILYMSWIATRLIADPDVTRRKMLENIKEFDKEVEKAREMNYQDVIIDTLEILTRKFKKEEKILIKDISRWMLCLDIAYVKRKNIKCTSNQFVDEVISLKEGMEKEFPMWNDFGLNWQLEDYDEEQETNIEEDENLLWI